MQPEERQIANLSGWIMENQGVQISSANLDSLLALRTPSVSEKAEKLMHAIEKHSRFIGGEVEIPYDNGSNPWLSYSWSLSGEELTFLVEKLLIQEEGWISDNNNAFSLNKTVQLTPSGYAYLEKIRQEQGAGVQGFCAMWFNESVLSVWTDAISPAITKAGYQPIRIDEVNHNNRIDDEIMAQIRRSRFVVADFTGNRGGVYFEAGFALGLGIPVIWTVQDECLADIHFDNRQYNFLQWSLSDMPSFLKSLQSRIEATLGQGPLRN
ncbi:hypothetical protein [Sideroxyarcus sp. TK5]